MRVSSLLDIVSGVFMLSHGVRPDDVGLWVPAAARAVQNGDAFWTRVVGVDIVHASRHQRR